MGSGTALSQSLSLFSVEAILILSTDDRSRILARYYNPPHQKATIGNFRPQSRFYTSFKEQSVFEKGLIEKTNKSTNDMIIFDGKLVSFKAENDVMFYVVGDEDENEAFLQSVVVAFRDSLNILLKMPTDKRSLVENYDLISLAVDEICDDGIALEIDPIIVASRVSKAPTQDVQLKSVDFSEQGVMNLLEMGKKSLADRIRQL